MAQDVTPHVMTDVIPADILNPPWEEENAQRSESLKQLFFLVFKWRWLILSLTLVSTIAAAVAMYLKPPAHTATAKVLFKQDRLSMQIANITSPTIGKTPYSLQLLSSELELMRSRSVLLPAAKKLLAEKGTPVEEIREQDIEEEVQSMEAHLLVISVPDTNVIQATYSAQTAQGAVRALAAILHSYQEQHSVAHSGATELLRFYQQEESKAAAALHESEEELRKWQETTNVVSIEEQIKSQIQVRTTLQTSLHRVEEEMVRSTEELDPFISEIKNHGVKAEVELQDLLHRYTEEDRRVQDQKEQVALLKKELTIAEQNLLASKTAERDTLRRQLREIDVSLASLREKKFGFDRLSLPVKINQDAFLLYGKQQDQARIAAGMDEQQLANIATIEEPYLSSDSDLPKRIAIVCLAGILGLFLGLAAAIGLALFNSSLRMEEDVERYLRLPVLAVIPDLQRSVSP